MQLKYGFALAGALVLMGTGMAFSQSLSPMRKAGVTPSDVKGFRLTVGNPYHQRMTFTITPTDPATGAPAQDATATPSEVVLAPGYARTIILAFKIPAPRKERTVGLCIVPKHIEGPILPRVCGTYTGSLLSRDGG